jgi:murein DD-endopeptidase MepM/ murein hydrolase activator NlpD
MRQFVLLILAIFLSLAGRSQQNISNIIDTVDTKNGPVLLYRNFSWEYMRDEPVMMSSEDDSTGIFTSGWIHDQIFGYMGASKRDSIKDTVLILTSKDRPFHMPRYGRLFRGFTYTHKGLDIGLEKGDTVRAAFDGVVRYAKYNRGGFGNLIILRHFNGLETYYAHLSKIKVTVNQMVKAGDLVGFGGSTGRSRAPHLHFEVRYKDVPMDALKLIDFDNQKLICNTLPITRKVFYPSNYDGKAVMHKIRTGDTLGKIAKKYHTTTKEICALNKMKPGTPLHAGRSIRVK